MSTSAESASQCIPITELKPDAELGSEEDGRGGGAGLGAELHGSRPSESYIELERGLSTMKLAPKLLAVFAPYVEACLGVLNMVVDVVADVGARASWRARAVLRNTGEAPNFIAFVISILKRTLLLS